MIGKLKVAVQKMLNQMGFEVIRTSVGFHPDELAIIKQVTGYTGTSLLRITGLINAVHYLMDNRIPGDFVECGVWRGGSMMAAAYALLQRKDTSRHLYLFDTFEGMSAPTDKDVMFDGQKAGEILDATPKREGPGNYWCWAGIEDVRANMARTGYPAEKIHLIQGKVEDTLPGRAPQSIAMLRLDTDWYESTRHELEHLYPRVAPNGVIILDDYGHWKGAREAVDEYFGAQPFRPFLNRLDYSGRLIIKPA